MSTNCKYIDSYINIVKSEKIPVCQEQKQLIEFVEHLFSNEEIYVDNEQAEKYFSYEKYFPYKLIDWEKFCFVLHNCTYDKDGELRFPILVVYVGRGAGKNGYLAFEDFCLLTETNGVQEYDIDIFATSEDQAKASWKDVYNVLENNKKKMSNHFTWTKELIKNKKTNSEFRYNTSSYKTKDGRRPGKVDFDEYHAYSDAKLISVGITGLGKKRHPRRTIISTDGEIREGVLDQLLEKCRKILNREIPDNGTLPFLCRLDSDEEINIKDMWVKANPSLVPEYANYKHLFREIEIEHSDYLENPVVYADFAIKRMNRPQQISETGIIDFKYIKATSHEIPEKDIYGLPCVAGIDYMKTNDFLGAGLLYKLYEKYIFIHHTWVCTQSKDLKENRIKAPLKEWEAQGHLTFVDGPEIPPDIPVCWLLNEAAARGSVIIKIAMDYYRYTYLQKALNNYGYFSDKRPENSNIKLVRPSDEMQQIPLITSGFVNYNFIWGNDPVIRWSANNTKIETRGVNMTYGKIEAKSRKNDTFKAFVAAFSISDILGNENDSDNGCWDLSPIIF